MTFTLTSDPTPRPRWTQRAGAAAQRSGKSFQEMIEFSAGIQKDIVTLEQLPALGSKPIGKGRFVRARICIDFIGVFNGEHGRSGDPFMFDAKSCGKAKNGFDANQWHKESPHQAKFLRRMGKAGAVAGLLVRAEAVGMYLFGDISDMDVIDAIKFSRDGKICRQWKPCGEICGTVDFLAIRRHYFFDAGTGCV